LVSNVEVDFTDRGIICVVNAVCLVASTQTLISYVSVVSGVRATTISASTRFNLQRILSVTRVVNYLNIGGEGSCHQRMLSDETECKRFDINILALCIYVFNKWL